MAYVIFILPADGFGPTGSAIGRKYKAVGVSMDGIDDARRMCAAQRCPLGQHALGIHILSSRDGWLVMMAYRTERMTQMLMDYPNVLTKASARWLGLRNYDESIPWMLEGEWSVYRLDRDDDDRDTLCESPECGEPGYDWESADYYECRPCMEERIQSVRDNAPAAWARTVEIPPLPAPDCEGPQAAEGIDGR